MVARGLGTKPSVASKRFQIKISIGKALISMTEEENERQTVKGGREGEERD